MWMVQLLMPFVPIAPVRIDASAGHWNGWSPDAENTRSQTAAAAGLSLDGVLTAHGGDAGARVPRWPMRRRLNAALVYWFRTGVVSNFIYVSLGCFRRGRDALRGFGTSLAGVRPGFVLLKWLGHQARLGFVLHHDCGSPLWAGLTGRANLGTV